MDTQGKQNDEEDYAELTERVLPDPEQVEALRRRLGAVDKRQVAAWRAMQPHERLAIAFQAYQFALEAVRVTERARHPDLSEEELGWRVTRRMQGDQTLGPPGSGEIEEEYLQARAARGSREKFLRAMLKVADVEPEERDRL